MGALVALALLAQALTVEVGSEFITLSVCRKDFTQGAPPRFVVLKQKIAVRKKHISGVGPGAMGDPQPAVGAPCVRILVQGKTLFVLGPMSRLLKEFEQ